MTDDTTLPFWFPVVRGKKLTAAFDGGRLSSDGGVILLAEVARRMGIADKLAAVIPDRRDPTRVVHPLAEILLARSLPGRANPLHPSNAFISFQPRPQ